MSQPITNWKLETDPDGIAWLGFDKADSGTNVLSGRIMAELDSVLQQLERRAPRALVIHSAKQSGFVAGADIKEFTGLETPEQAFELIRGGQQVFDRLAAMSCPTVALINGFALGGGLELALACDYRIAARDSKVAMGLPEVKLGIHPGFGGTVRSVRIVGVFAAMDMMLTGRSVRADRALGIGLVDKLVPLEELREAGREMALHPPARHGPGVKERLLHLKPVRAVVAGRMQRQVAAKARKEHYPAPYAIIDLWSRFGGRPAVMLREEAHSIARLMCSETSRNLVRVFMLQDRLKSLGGRGSSEARRVHVVGAGVMGGDIAAWCALRGLEVTLQDRAAESLQPALDRAHKLFHKRLKSESAVAAATERLRPDVEAAGVPDADIVIEAVFEDAEVKKELYRALEPRMKPDALLATNTSSIRLEELADGLGDPGRLIGLHFFNPVAKMPLVEVIGAPSTREEDLARGLAFTRKLDRLPLPCRSAPGFVVNRVLMPYLMEAILLVEEGVPMAAVDEAATDFGMPMGPLELADTVGLDVGYHVAGILSQAFDLPVPRRLAEMVERGQLGQKTGRGFYEYRDGKPVKTLEGGYRPPADISDRLILPMLNEAVACHSEGIVQDTDLLDAGIIFGTGFAPFRGGPIHYAQTRGIDAVVASLSRLEQAHGERFRAHPGWGTLGG